MCCDMLSLFTVLSDTTLCACRTCWYCRLHLFVQFHGESSLLIQKDLSIYFSLLFTGIEFHSIHFTGRFLPQRTTLYSLTLLHIENIPLFRSIHTFTCYQLCDIIAFECRHSAIRIRNRVHGNVQIFQLKTKVGGGRWGVGKTHKHTRDIFIDISR